MDSCILILPFKGLEDLMQEFLAHADAVVFDLVTAEEQTVVDMAFRDFEAYRSILVGILYRV